MLIDKLNAIGSTLCDCGKPHIFKSKIITGKEAILSLPSQIKELGAKKPYILADENTLSAAGRAVCELLSKSEIPYSLYRYGENSPEPDEKSVGCALMNLPYDSDIIIGVGSGVINDISKIISAHTRLPFIIVATAPSMDGYASMSSSVTLDGIKVSLPSRCADVIIGDTDIIKSAPKKMLLSGIGDMIAKYISICEWRIASIITGEYYCEEIAALIRLALERTLSSATAALDGDEAAISEIFDALIVGSVAMNYAGVSRPASGCEHYVSHLYDTRGVEFGERTEFHGIQCAIATLISSIAYEKLKSLTPCREKALEYVKNFDLCAWNSRLEALLGKSAKPLIELEKKEGKHDEKKHRARLDIILDKWEKIVEIINEEIPPAKQIEEVMKSLGMPTSFSEVGMRSDVLPEIFAMSGEIRDKYVLSRLLWDLGLLEEFVHSELF